MCDKDQGRRSLFLYGMCAEGGAILILARPVEAIGLGRKVVEHIDDHSLLQTGNHGRSEFLLSMMRQHAVDKADMSRII